MHATPIIPLPLSDESRLRLAMRQVDDALAAQAAAMAELRDALGALRGTVGGLSGSLEGLRESLHDTAAEVARAHAAALELQATSEMLERRAVAD